MPDLGLSADDLKAIREILGRFPAVELALVFGSRAKGSHKNGSDVDLALKGAGLSFEKVMRISSLLNEETLMPYRFDVVHYEALQSAELVGHIDRVGVEIFSNSAGNPLRRH